MPNIAYGIDLGTSNIKIYSRVNDSIINEKNMIAIENKKSLFAYGDSAYEMYEKAPSNINISYPLSAGVIADIKNMETLVKLFLADKKGMIHPGEYFMSVPTDVTEVERRAFYDLIKDANVKAKSILVVEKAVADAIGMGIDVKNAEGVLTVNVGYDTTEISILSLGGIVLSKLCKVGGYKFDDAIKNMIRKEFKLIIGGKTAEKVKIQLQELEEEGKPALVYGRDIISGLPVEREIPTDMIDQCLLEYFKVIIDNVKMLLEQTPPELSADIYRQGICLSGGAASISRFAYLLSKGTGLKVNLAEEPQLTVVHGLETIIKNNHYRSVAHDLEGTLKK